MPQHCLFHAAITAGLCARTFRFSFLPRCGTFVAWSGWTINILQATHQAMSQALARLQPAPDHVLVDGLLVKSLCFPQTALVKGDARSFSIAAASILAKVTRDRLMLEYDRQFPAYGFALHK